MGSELGGNNEKSAATNSAQGMVIPVSYTIPSIPEGLFGRWLMRVLNR